MTRRRPLASLKPFWTSKSFTPAKVTPSNKVANTKSTTLDDDGKAALDVHNCGTLRPALTWNAALAAEAAAYSKQLMEVGSFQHSGTKGEGENLAKFMPATVGSLAKGVEVWCGEEKIYQGQPIDESFRKYGHWTQVIWPMTTEVGLGVARGNGECLVVGRYKEPGNSKGRSAWSGK
jgi:hypothetical protein